MKFKNLIFLFLTFLLFACGQTTEKQENKVFDSREKAYWISYNRSLPTNDSLFYLDHPAPQFRKEFNTDSRIGKATLYITAAGYYKASLNGKAIKDNILDPAWTDFSKRIYYSEYDVTTLINDGANCLGVILGNGFYNPLPLRKWGHRNLRNDLSVGKPAFIAKLCITDENGKKQEIISDQSWKYNYGPIIKNSVYLGTVYDAHSELPAWNLSGYNDDQWYTAEISPGPGGELQKAFFPPVKISRKIDPVSIYSVSPGIYIIDMGVNFTGTYQIDLSGNKDDTIVFRFGERVYEDGTLNPMTSVVGQIKKRGVGGPGAPEIAWQTDSYIFGNNSKATFSPPFTYHTYRYIEIRGLDEKPGLRSIKGLFLHSDVENINTFSCSSELLNSIQEATERTFLANLVSVQSDCPAREKFGYGGDINATSESFIYNFNMQEFYRKTVYDWIDAMYDSGFVDTAPFTGIEYCGISWESAFLLTQYYLYLYYKDTEIIEELYEQDLEWMEKVARIHPGGLVEHGLSDHESLEPVPVQLTGTCHYLQCARVMQTFAEVMGDNVNKLKYEKLAEKLKSIVKKEFWDNPVDGKINRQTLYSTLLYHKILPDDEIEAARDSLLKAIENGPDAHFNTGIFGTKYVLETLSEYSSPDYVFNIVNSVNFPGWGYMIERGATTIWETWEESDNTYSNCHPMFGTVTEWYYRWLGGIRPDTENPGFKEFFIAPTTPEGLEHINCSYNSPYGEIISSWKKTGKESYQFEISIPAGSKARLKLSGYTIQSMYRNLEPFEPEKSTGSQASRYILKEGKYLINTSVNP